MAEASNFSPEKNGKLSDTVQLDSEADTELNDLLDSALQDFDKHAQPGTKCNPDVESTRTVSEQADQTSSDRNSISNAGVDPVADQIAGAAAAHFEAAFQAMIEEQPEVMQNLERLAEVAEKAASGDAGDSNQNFASTLAQTVQSLTKNAEDIQNPITEEDLMQAMGSMGLGADGSDFFTAMQGMVSSLLSKDVLYPSLQEIASKYPEWLEANKSTIDAQEYERYSKQYVVMCDVCKEFESEKQEDTDAVKKARFERIMAMMQQMQEHGQPPADLVGDMGPQLPFDEEGNPKPAEGLPPGSEQCHMQ